MVEDIEKARTRFPYADPVMKLTMAILLTIAVSVLLPTVTSSTMFNFLVVAAFLIFLKLHYALFKLLVKYGYYYYCVGFLLASMKESEEIIRTRGIRETTRNTAFRWDGIIVVYGFAVISWIAVLVSQWNGSIARAKGCNVKTCLLLYWRWRL